MIKNHLKKIAFSLINVFKGIKTHKAFSFVIAAIMVCSLLWIFIAFKSGTENEKEPADECTTVECIRIKDSLAIHDDSVRTFLAHIRDSIAKHRTEDSLSALKERRKNLWILEVKSLESCMKDWRKCEYISCDDDRFGHNDSIIVDVNYKVLNRYPANQSCVPFTNKCSYNEEKYEFKITNVKKVRLGDLNMWVPDNKIRKDISRLVKKLASDGLVHSAREVNVKYPPVKVKILESISDHEPVEGARFIKAKSELKEVCDWDGCRYLPKKKFETYELYEHFYVKNETNEKFCYILGYKCNTDFEPD